MTSLPQHRHQIPPRSSILVGPLHPGRAYRIDYVSLSHFLHRSTANSIVKPTRPRSTRVLCWGCGLAVVVVVVVIICYCCCSQATPLGRDLGPPSTQTKPNPSLFSFPPPSVLFFPPLFLFVFFVLFSFFFAVVVQDRPCCAPRLARRFRLDLPTCLWCAPLPPTALPVADWAPTTSSLASPRLG